MTRALLLLAVLFAGCAACDTDALTADGDPAVAEYVWVAPDAYCARIDALGCTTECADGVLCRRDLADACLAEVEATFTDCDVVPHVLTEDPVCAGFCVPEGETYQP